MNPNYKNLGKVCLTPAGEWSRDKTYERIDIVTHPITNRSYIAKQDVPIGINIDNQNYWQQIGAGGFRDNNIIILSDYDNNGELITYTLESAINNINYVDRRPGLILGFYGIKSDSNTISKEWFMYQFNSNTVDDWNDVSCWVSIYDNIDKFKGFYLNECLLVNNFIPTVGDYAFVGESMEDAVLYVCIEDGNWKNTQTTAFAFANKYTSIHSKDFGEFETKLDESYANRAIKDALGNVIHDTYVTSNGLSSFVEEEVTKEVAEKIDDIQIAKESITWDKLAAGVKQRIGSAGAVVNSPDDEDLTVNDDNQLKFANKAYSPNNYSGLGRIYLRKNIVNGINILEQSMINKSNTIYIIQYDYCLNGQTIVIPENCVLKFEGGGFSNGTIDSNGYIKIIANYKVFNNCAFSDNISNQLVANIIWFTDNYITDISISSTLYSDDDLDYIFNKTNLYKFIIPKGIFFNINKKVVINKSIIISGEYNASYGNTNRNNIVNNFGYSCGFYSEHCENDDSVIEIHSNINLNNIIIKDIDFVSKINTEHKVLSIIADNANLWGINIDANFVKIGNIITNSKGISIDASGGVIAYIRIGGYVQGFDYAYEFKHTDSNSWINDIIIKGDSRCVHGNVANFEHGGKLIIYGSHQPIANLSANNGESYFSGRIVNMYGTIWDINIENNNLYTVQYPIKITEDGGYNKDYEILDTRLSIYTDFYKDRFGRDYFNINVRPVNILNTLYSANKHQSILSYLYHINDVNIENFKIYNSNHLFGTIESTPIFNINSIRYYNSPYILFDAEQNNEIKIKITLSTSAYASLNNNIPLYYRYCEDTIIKIYYDDDSNIKEYNINKGDMYYRADLFKVKNLFINNSATVTIEIITSYNHNNLYLPLPLIYIPAPSTLDIISGGISNNRPNFQQNGFGFQYFDTTLNKPIWWTGSKWVDAMGANV